MGIKYDRGAPDAPPEGPCVMERIGVLAVFMTNPATVLSTLAFKTGTERPVESIEAIEALFTLKFILADPDAYIFRLVFVVEARVLQLIWFIYVCCVNVLEGPLQLFVPLNDGRADTAVLRLEN